MDNKVKRIMIKEELLAITGDHMSAIILNQFLYWTDRIRDFDRFIEEEQKRMTEHQMSSNFELQNGWIFKTSKQLAKEMMNITSEKTIERRLKDLVELGYLDARLHPTYKWDKTKQYRVSIRKIQIDLINKGYSLEGYKFVNDLPFVSVSNRCDTVTNREDRLTDQPDTESDQSGPIVEAIPEITLKTNEEEDEEDKPNVCFRKREVQENLQIKRTQASINQDVMEQLMNINKVDPQTTELLRLEVRDIIGDLDSEAIQIAFKKMMNRVRNGHISHIPRWFRTTVLNENCTVRQKRKFELEVERSWQKYSPG